MMSAAGIAAEVRSGQRSARAFAEAAIAAIRAKDGAIGAVTRLLDERALAEADAVDAIVAAGRDPGPLAGVPYGVKDLFDVAGLPTTAGAGMRADATPAVADAEAVARLKAAGAVLIATLNMDEYAYGFVTVNAAYGTTRNPHDPARLCGGSSGGSAAAVAAGMLPLSLGSDTNGSIRIPAALTGLYGLKPTHGALPMAGVFPFVESFDDIGPFARSVADLELAWTTLSGHPREGGDPSSLSAHDGLGWAPAFAGVTVGRLDGWFRADADPELLDGLDGFADALGGGPLVELPEVARARSAAFVMTAAEGGALHLPTLRTRAMDYDPATRDRLLAGALLPAAHYVRAQRFRSWFAARAAELFERFDVLLAPAAPCVAPLIDDQTMIVGGEKVPARANIGLLTQPLSFIGLPVLTVPLLRPGRLPLGVQLVGKPGGEATLFAAAARLEAAGLTGFSEPCDVR
ncbi:AtzE family amidohydrolase [Sphingomonas crocodyli]|uniref:AtzE family amidohydrolase n=1 Tax=Sphingomonas crocodyli TaxID=1979270 RepID=A0A437LUS0_9SPHN|nr:AtzE family amidohydrolase [Sphingomonas crocodyli]RVT89181.1 AtzE family amidohydrolase [Sphingomonas crocodyli]